MEQDQIQTETDPNAEPTDAELVAAAQEAGGTASVDVAAEAAAAAAGTLTPAQQAAAGASAGDPAEPAIAAVIRAREKAFAERQQAEDFAANRRAQAEAEAAKVLADARARAAADYEAELQARRQKFHETPTEALRQLGFKTEDLVDSVTREGTAEWRAIRAAEERAKAAEAKAGAVDTVKADFEAFKNQIAAREQEAYRANVERQFLTEHAAPEKAPYLHKRYEPDEIISKAHALANQWRAAGVPFANSDVAAYLEHQARQRLAGVAAPPPQVSGSSGAPKVRANGSRTLSAGQGSERRASPKPIEEMSPDEERQALMEVAAEARRTGG